MTDKVQKILSEIATRKLCTMDEHMAFYNDKAKEDYWLLSEIEEFIKASQEESVSEGLGDYINELSKQFPEVSFAKLSRIAVRVVKWQKERLPKWKKKPVQRGIWSGEIGVHPTNRVFRYEHYIINADKLFKLLDKEE